MSDINDFHAFQTTTGGGSGRTGGSGGCLTWVLAVVIFCVLGKIIG